MRHDRSAAPRFWSIIYVNRFGNRNIRIDWNRYVRAWRLRLRPADNWRDFPRQTKQQKCVEGQGEAAGQDEFVFIKLSWVSGLGVSTWITHQSRAS